MKPPAVFAANDAIGRSVSRSSNFPRRSQHGARSTLIDPDNQTIENPAFYFHRATAIRQRKLFLDYEYHSRTDAVLPEAVPAYVRQLGLAERSDGLHYFPGLAFSQAASLFMRPRTIMAGNQAWARR